MTVEQVAKALECCIKGECSKCPLSAMVCGDEVVMQYALDLIKRQQAEIEKYSITLTMRDTELRTITNLFCKARSQIDFNKNEYIVNAELFTAITILHHERIPAFELSVINELYQKGGAE